MTFVSGYMTPGESAETAALREVKEELGIEPEQLDFAGTYWFGKRELLMIGFIAQSKKCAFKLSGEVDSALWAAAEDVPKLIFPDSPGNAAFGIYKKFVSRSI